jgi:peptidyl-prolyl cis-trans isomerase C
MISVNGILIEAEAVAREMQHHPAPKREDAEFKAGMALVVRELLLQRANQLEIAGADEEERIANLIGLEVRVPDPTDEEVARYYRRNGLKFMTPALYAAAHIFFPARPDDADARELAKLKAKAVLAELLREPDRFAELANAHSACSSKEQGGSLGQVRRGDTNPELEQAMASMQLGIAPEPIGSRHGYHVVRLDRRVPAKSVPLDQAKKWIENHLRSTSRHRAIAQYIQLLTGRAEISGIALAGADSPLLQ